MTFIVYFKPCTGNHEAQNCRLTISWKYIVYQRGKKATQKKKILESVWDSLKLRAHTVSTEKPLFAPGKVIHLFT